MNYYVIEGQDAIYGVGTNEAAAWADCEQWLDTTSPSYSRDGFKCVQATKELFEQVLSDGGAIAWGEIPDGTRCTVDQESAALES